MNYGPHLLKYLAFKETSKIEPPELAAAVVEVAHKELRKLFFYPLLSIPVLLAIHFLVDIGYAAYMDIPRDEFRLGRIDIYMWLCWGLLFPFLRAQLLLRSIRANQNAETTDP